MRVPLHGFFVVAHAQYGLAPAQLTPNGWCVMAGFLVLCHSAGVAMFRHFFRLPIVFHKHRKGWYFFQSRDGSGLRFTGMPNPNVVSIKDWKRGLLLPLFAGSVALRRGVGQAVQELTHEAGAHCSPKQIGGQVAARSGGAAVDLRKYLSSSSLAAAMIATTASPPPLSTRTTPSSIL